MMALSQGQEVLGVLGVVLVVIVVIAANLIRNSEVRKLKGEITEAPAVKAQLDVIAAKARKRRSDYGTKRTPKTNPNDYGVQGDGGID